MTKILIADDDAGVVRLLTKILTEKGFEVISVDNGLDAMVKVQKEKPDLLILDVMMPEINGYDVCLKIKFDEKLKDTPIILLTIRDRELNPKIGQEASIAYIQKPVDPDLILGAIDLFLEEHRK